VCAPLFSTSACPGKQHSPALADLTDEVISNGLVCFDHLSIMENACFE